MTYIDDLGEPGDGREPEPPEAEPLDLDAVLTDYRESMEESRITGPRLTAVLAAVPDLIAELRRAREQLAYWQGLEEDTVYASAHGGKQRPDDCALWVHHRDGEAADRSVAAAAGAATAYMRVRTLHPWVELAAELPF